MHNFLEHFPDTLAKGLTLIELLRHRALYQADQTLYTFLQDGETESFRLTCGELDQQARAIAASLQSLVAPGDRAILVYQSGLDYIAAFFGCLYASVVAVPAYPPRRNQNQSRLQSIVADAQATVVLTTTAELGKMDNQIAQNPELAALHWLPTDLIASHLASEWQEPMVSGSDLAFLQYTSGSTGTPRGVMVSHENLLQNLTLIHQCFEHAPHSRGVIWLPPYHDMGLIGGILQPLFGGFPVVLMSPFAFLQKPLRWLEAISRYQATTSGGPNFAYDLACRQVTPEQRATLDLSRWDVAFTGAEPIRAETLDHFAHTFAECGFRREAFYPCYGMAETTLIISGGLKADPPLICQVDKAALEQNQVVVVGEEYNTAQAIVSCGRSWLDQKIEIVDPETFIPCHAGKVGEIWVSSSSVALGYWKQPENTEATFRAYLNDSGNEPFLRTGDLGFVQDGELFVTGRLKDLIIIRGCNHYPQDIELTATQSHPALRSGCGAAILVEVDGVEQLAIACEVERNYLRQLDVQSVATAIRQAVSKHHDLQVYTVALLKTASIPKTSSGKIKRHACQAGFWDGSLDVVGHWTAMPQDINLEQQAQVNPLQEQGPSEKQGLAAIDQTLTPTSTPDEIENWLIAYLALYLKVPSNEININEPFANYGMDSSVAVSATGELAQWLNLELDPTLFWEYPSIKAVVQYLSQECRYLQPEDTQSGDADT
ncbi:AMP-binding protein [Phormidesmis priestleyi]|uniref:AMP-binding protein n=1 Tax=Phormidesmis priestleyi TaxID=268141 RepID=UPI000932C586|nr:AMP-binding protein [Phormidesmis priestleyi]